MLLTPGCCDSSFTSSSVQLNASRQRSKLCHFGCSISFPIVSEKSYQLLETGVYTFRVHLSASKPEIADAVRAIFNVKVLKVNTLNRKGKRVRDRKTGQYGQRANTKRALVTLAAGESIPLFEA